MKKKTIVIALFLSTIVNVSASNMSKKALIYANGVNDTLTIGEKYFKDKRIYGNEYIRDTLNGYLTYTDVTDEDEATIVRITAIGLKQGYNVVYYKRNGRDIVSFGINNRKADAVYIEKRLATYKIETKVIKINEKLYRETLVARKLISTIKKNINEILSDKDAKIKSLESFIKNHSEKKNEDYYPKITNDDAVSPIYIEQMKECACPKPKPCKKTKIVYKTKKIPVNIDFSNLQVVNRVITSKYLKKYANGNVSNVAPLNREAKKHMTAKKVQQQIKIVKRNLKKDKDIPIPNLRTFPEAYNYLRQHAVITNDSKLLVNGRILDVNDKIGSFKITKIVYERGIVILDHYNVAKLKKQQS